MNLYIIKACDENRTYVGITSDFSRRLRQHNGELKGGAKYTRGRKWALVVLVTGFPAARDARQIEWRLHRRNGRCRCKDRVRGRIIELSRAFAMERWTKTARPTAELLPLLTLNWGSASNKTIRKQTWPGGLRHVQM